MHELLARALELGSAAEGLTDARGDRVEVVEEEGFVRARVTTAAGELAGFGWRCDARPARPGGWPDDVPFLPGLSCAGAAGHDGITVTWPAEGALGGRPSTSGGPSVPGFAVGGGFPTHPRLTRGPVPPVASLDVEGAARGLGGAPWEALSGALDALVAKARDRGWEVTGRQKVEGELAGRVVRLREGVGPRRRTLTLTRALGVASLVWREEGG